MQTMTSFPQPNVWILQHLANWLNKHPIDVEDDISFIKKTVSKRISVAENTTKEKEKQDADFGRLGSVWTG